MSTQQKEEYVQLDFVVVGSRKCATSWLYELFLAHPQVCVSTTVKQSGFFTKYFERGLSWYTKLFHDWQESIVGEVDPDIITCPEGPSRIYAMFPNVKIIAIFRNPPDLFFSSYEHALRKGDTYETPEQVWNNSAVFREEVKYGTLLQHLYDVFPSKQVLVLFYEDIDANPASTLATIGDYLGLTSSFNPQSANRRVNASRVAKNLVLSKLFSRSARVARRLGLHSLVNRLKRTSLAKSNYELADRKKLDTQRSGKLRSQILNDVQHELVLFEQLSNQNIVRVWPEVDEFLRGSGGGTTS